MKYDTTWKRQINKFASAVPNINGAGNGCYFTCPICGNPAYVHKLKSTDSVMCGCNGCGTVIIVGKEENSGESYLLGDIIEKQWCDIHSDGVTEYTVPMRIAHFSERETDKYGNIQKGAFLQWEYATPFDTPFDAKEALYDVGKDGLPAGEYYFTVENRYYKFLLPMNLTDGNQLVLKNWELDRIQVFKDETSFEPLYEMYLMEEKDRPTGTCLGEANGIGEVNDICRALYGYNRYKNSAVRQWLNSSAGVGAWWTKQNKWDRAPSQLNTYAGFLAGYSDDFVSAMKPIKIQVAANTVTDSGVTDVMYDKVFLPSLEQMYVNPQVSGIEGEAWDYYKQLAAANGRTGKYAQYGTYAELKSYSISAKTTACYVRLRSALRGYANGTWYVYTSGYVYSYGTASYGLRARPACFI